MGAGFDLFMINPYWRQLYENAPSEALRQHYRHSFEYSGLMRLGMDEEEADKQTLKEWGEAQKLSREDLRYLLDNTTNQMEKAFIRRLIANRT